MEEETAMLAQKRSKLSTIKSNLMIDDSMYAASESITKENEGPKSQASMICNARACHVNTPVMKIQAELKSDMQPLTTQQPPARLILVLREKGSVIKPLCGMNRRVCRRRLGESWEDTDEMQ